jgi:hypothetical protein
MAIFVFSSMTRVANVGAACAEPCALVVPLLDLSRPTLSGVVAQDEFPRAGPAGNK